MGSMTTGRKPSESSRSAAGSMMPAGDGQQRTGGCRGRPRPRGRRRGSRSAACSSGPGDRRRRSACGGRRAAPGRRGTGRPWCRSSGARGPRRRRRTRRRRGSSYRAKPFSANDARAAARIAARVSGEPRRRPRDGACGRSRGQPCAAGTTKCSRANSSDSTQVALALLAGGSLAGVDLQHDVAVEAGAGEVPQERRRPPSRRGRARGARPWPSRCRR